MKLRLIYIAVGIALVAANLRMRAQDPPFTTVCSVLKEPSAYAGKIVHLRATVFMGFEASIISEPDGSCEGGMWFSYAREKDDTSKETDERDAQLQKQQPVFLVKDENFKKFEAALDAHLYPRHENSGCMGCPLYTVTALMVGRIDYAGKDRWGFGHLNGYRLRFILSSVSDIVTVKKPFDEKEWSDAPIRFPHGTIKGKLTDVGGKPIYLGRVEAIPAKGKIPIINSSELTDEDGTYSIDVKPGEYLVVVNRDNPATKNVPMDTTYYPSADRREAAQIVSVTDWQTVAGVDIQPLRPLATKNLRVHVIWPDGKPVSEANVSVHQMDDPYAIAGDDEGGVHHTDSDGWTTLLTFTNHAYRLEANIYKKPGYVPYCENVFQLPQDFRDGFAISMVLRRQSESCRGQSDEVAMPLPTSAVIQ